MEAMEAKTQGIDFVETMNRMREKAGIPPYDPAKPQVKGAQVYEDEHGFTHHWENGREWAEPPKRTEGQWAAYLKDEGLCPPDFGPDQLSQRQQSIFSELAGGGKNALLLGKQGTGKTLLALMAMRKHYMENKSVIAVRFSTFKSHCEPKWLERHDQSEYEIIQRYRGVDFLLLDELSHGNTSRRFVTDHEQKVLMDVVSGRESHAEKRPTWITSNLSLPQLVNLYGEPIIGRLAQDGLVFDFSNMIDHRRERAHAKENR